MQHLPSPDASQRAVRASFRIIVAATLGSRCCSEVHLTDGATMAQKGKEIWWGTKRGKGAARLGTQTVRSQSTCFYQCAILPSRCLRPSPKQPSWPPPTLHQILEVIEQGALKLARTGLHSQLSQDDSLRDWRQIKKPSLKP